MHSVFSMEKKQTAASIINNPANKNMPPKSYFLFSGFQEVKGYTYGEILLCFSVMQLSFSLAECCANGFKKFSGIEQPCKQKYAAQKHKEQRPSPARRPAHAAISHSQKKYDLASGIISPQVLKG